MSGEESTRKSERLRIYGEMLGEVMVYEPIAIREISRGGALIEVACALQVDSLHMFRLALGELSLVVRGRIVHSRISEVVHEVGGVVYTVGIEFIEPSEHVLDALGTFMARVAAERAAETR
jgi:hypothetical protein